MPACREKLSFLLTKVRERCIQIMKLKLIGEQPMQSLRGLEHTESGKLIKM